MEHCISKGKLTFVIRNEFYYPLNVEAKECDAATFEQECTQVES